MSCDDLCFVYLDFRGWKNGWRRHATGLSRAMCGILKNSFRGLSFKPAGAGKVLV